MTKDNGFKDFFGDIKQHLMTGISFMLPVIIIYALTMVLGNIPGPLQELMGLISTYAQMLIAPILATYIAYSIAGRLAIPTALVIGLLSDQLGMGFIGGLLIGLLTGYLVKLESLLLNKIKKGQSTDFIIGYFIIPIITPIVMGCLTYFVLARPISSAMVGLTNWLNNMSGTNAIILSAILGAMIAVDMGGPINKIAFSFALGAYTEGAYAVSTPVLVAISIPTLAMALATFLAPKKYSPEEKAAGKSAIVMGLIGLTEGAIPFAASDPFRVIPSIIVGSALGAVMASALGVTSKLLMPSVMGLAGANNIFLYILCHVVPVIITALLVNLLKKNIPEKPAEE